jgi:DNA-binding SARP family transcriptional activator/Tfp pilus assembly protein PilF
MESQADQQVRLLGPVDLRIGHLERSVAGTRRKAVLTVLALSAGQTVAVDRIVDAVWSGDAPATAANTLQSHVSYLRGLFRTRETIIASAPGYRLELPGDATDVREAERLIAQADQTDDAAERATLLRSALALWRSRPLADLSGIAWFDMQAERIERQRSNAYISLVKARLRLGEHAALVPELESLGDRHPFDEALHAELMLALYRSGRQADALEAYRRIRERLLDQLGIDPGRPLRDLETAILRQDSDLDTPSAVTSTTVIRRGSDAVPAQLPLALANVLGREPELELLDDALPTDGEESPAVVYAVSGPPGVGKTALAVAWAHRVASRFPDRQLYANLRGFSPQGTVIAACDVLHGFLEALGVPPQRIPETLPARMGLYRTLLAGKRVLVLLDNARDAKHVRSLLPAAPGSAAIITSRNKLTSLVATDGAVAVPLGVLSREAAHRILTQRLGQKLVATEPDAVDEIISRCAGLPLALGIVAARITTDRSVSLASIADEMLAACDALDALSGGDHRADVRVVISWSYAVLSPDAARLFRLMSIHPDAEMGLPAIASVGAVTIPKARQLVAELATANLVTIVDGGRYAFHDLIRAYAQEQSQTLDSAAGRADAMRGLLDYYLHSADVAAGLLDAYRDSVVSAEPSLEVAPSLGVLPASLADHEQALAFLTTEYRSLIELVRRAEASGFEAHAWQLASTLTEFFERRGLWQDWLATLRTALSAAERLGDFRGLAYSNRGLGRAHHWHGNYHEAAIHHRTALDYFIALDDSVGQARVWHSLGRLAELEGQLNRALANTQRGLDLFRAVNDKPGIAKALNGVGWYHCLLGDHEQALRCCAEALVLVQELGDQRVEANTWDSLGYAHHMAGDHQRAIECYEQALALFREMGDRYHEADASVHLGDAYASALDVAASDRMWRHALAILEDLGHADVGLVRAKLALM